MGKRSRRAATNRRNRERSKQQERRVAKFLGARRTPLSGGASGHTRGDVIDSEFYVEAKGVSSPNSSNGWIWRFLPDEPTCEESSDDCVLVHSSLLLTDCALDGELLPAQGLALWRDTKEKAEAEGKKPLLALFKKRRRGFWLFGAEETLWDVFLRRRRMHEQGE